MTVSAAISIDRPGLQTLLVDSGRVGYQHLGITQGGPLDQHSFNWANWLCANQENMNALEVFGSDFTFNVIKPCTIAITGAAQTVRINGQHIATWQSYRLEAGDRVEFSPLSSGLRSYVAIQSGFKVDPVFASCTTVTRDRLGGLDGQGKPIAAGDKLFAHRQFEQVIQVAPAIAKRPILDRLTLRIVKGYQYQHFTSAFKNLVCLQQYLPSPESNRMAVKLLGQPLRCESSSMYSEGISKGAVQVPPDGLPIVMLNDRQTVGGYPKLGSVLSIDCDALAQASSNTAIGFRFIDFQHAHNLICLQTIRQQRLRASIQSSGVTSK